MKKQIFALSVMLASVLNFTNCTKEEMKGTDPVEGGAPFSLTASIVDAKTANDNLKTNWVAEDAINLFHAEAGSTTYTNDGQFTVSDVATGKFDGNLAGNLTAASYDWYAFYPYSSYMTAPNGVAGYMVLGHKAGASITQNGNNSTAHLAGAELPLYAKATVAAGEPVVLSMNNLASVIKVIVTNTVDDPLTVSEVKFISTEDITGTYYFDLTQSPVVYTGSREKYVSSTASLTVTGGTALAKGASASFYIPVKPHTAATGSTLKISVNGYEKTLTLTKDVTFTAGSIKPMTFAYDNIEVIDDYVSIPWAEDFSGNLNLYTLTNGNTTTKIYEENTAGGTSPELLVSNTNGSFSAKVKALKGDYVLTFKSNHADYLAISADNEVAITGSYSTDKKSGDYTLSVPADVMFTLTFTNTNAKNTRLDDISLVAKLPKLTSPANLACTVQTDNSLTFTWDAVVSATGYQVSIDGGKTYEATQGETTYIWEGLPTGTTKTLFVKAIGDGINCDNSDEVFAVGTTTGETPEVGYEDDGILATWTFTSSSKPANNTDFTNNGATDRYSECTFNLNGSGSTWNPGAGKGYAFTAVTDITVTVKAEKILKKGATITLSMDTFYNKDTNAPMKGFDITVKEGTGAASTTGCDVNSWTLGTSSANKTVTYTLQNDVEVGGNVSFILTQTGKVGAGQGFANNVKAEYKN